MPDPGEFAPWEWQDAWDLLGAEAPIGMAVTDAQHRFVWVNEALAQVHGVAVGRIEVAPSSRWFPSFRPR